MPEPQGLLKSNDPVLRNFMFQNNNVLIALLSVLKLSKGFVKTIELL